MYLYFFDLAYYQGFTQLAFNNLFICKIIAVSTGAHNRNIITKYANVLGLFVSVTTSACNYGNELSLDEANFRLLFQNRMDVFS